MSSFDFDPSIQVVFGSGRLSELGEHVRSYSRNRVLLVTDPGIVKAGLAERAETAMHGIDKAVFSAVDENPSSRNIEAGVAMAKDFGVDLIVAVGGGSAMDCAKGINFLLTNGGRIEDYHGFGKAEKPMLPSIGVPTTAGTGSEAQSYALISHSETHVKMACGDRKARFGTVILDPDLVGSAPRQVKATAGYDAIAHAVESYVCTRANPISTMYAREAYRLLDGALEPFVNDNARSSAGDVLLGAHLAGMAIEASMLGAAHACANPLTAEYGTTHGIAVGVMLPVVVRHNLRDSAPRYSGLSGYTDLPQRLTRIRASLELPQTLEDLGVTKDAIPGLASAASEQWTGTFNPSPVDEGVCRELYESAL